MIRPATVEDVPAVLPMVRKIAAFHENLDPGKYGYRDDPGEMYRNWLSGKPADVRSVFLVADARARADVSPHIVGFLIGTMEAEIPIYRLKEFGFIHDLWVEEEYRHEGVARQLVLLALERFTQMGAKQVRLDVLVDNDPASKLFQTCGFRPTVTEMLMEL